MAFEPTLDLMEIVERIDERFSECDETLESLVKRLDAQEATIARLRNEIAEMRRPKPTRRGCDIDTAQVELR